MQSFYKQPTGQASSYRHHVCNERCCNVLKRQAIFCMFVPYFLMLLMKQVKYVCVCVHALITNLCLIASSSTGRNFFRADDVYIHVHGAAAPMLL